MDDVESLVLFAVMAEGYYQVNDRRFEMLDKVDFGWGAVAAVLAGIFGEYWILPAGLVALNIVDYVTGSIKARRFQRSSSVAGAQGIIKKVAIWIVIALSFYASFAIVMIGDIFGYNLHLAMSFGWLTLSMYLVNEMRSILENLVELDVEVPTFLVKGLDITKKMLEARAKEQEEAVEEVMDEDKD